MSDENRNGGPFDPAGGSDQTGVGQLAGVRVLGSQTAGADGSERYYIQRKSGKVFGPFEESLIHQMIEGGKLTGNEGVSKDKRVWIPILAVSSFAQLFRSRSGSVDAAPPPGQEALPGPGVNSDSRATQPGRPGATSAGTHPAFSDISMPEPVGFDGMAGLGLGEAAKPTFERLPSSLSGLMELPAPKTGGSAGGVGGLPELPKPKPAGGFAFGDSLPELPRPRTGAGIGLPEPPRPVGNPFGDPIPELPRPSIAGGPELPRPAGGGIPELPRPAGHPFPELPRPAGSAFPELPRPAGNPYAELPRPASELPQSAAQLPGSRGRAELPIAVDPATGRPEAGNLPTRKLDYDGLPLAGGGSPFDSLSGFGDDGGFDFGAPGRGAGPDRSLPFPNQDFSASGIDLDMGDTGAAPPPPVEGSAPLGVELGGSGSGLSDAYGAADFEDASSYGTPFESRDEPAVGEGAAKGKGKGKGKAKKAKTAGAGGKSRVPVLVGAGLLVVAAVAGVLASGILDGEEPVEEPTQRTGGGTDIVLAPATVVDLALLNPGTFAAYQGFLEEAVAASNSRENQDRDAVARVVIGQALAAAQYGESADPRRAEQLAGSTDPLHALARGANHARVGELDQALALLEPLHLGEYGTLAHFFTGLAELERYRRAVAAYRPVVAAPAPEDATGGEGGEGEGAAGGEDGEGAAEGGAEGDAEGDAEAVAAAGAAPEGEGADAAEEATPAEGSGEGAVAEAAPPVVLEPPVLDPLALESFQTAVRLDESFVPAAYFATVAQRLQGDTEAAQAGLEALVSAHPELLLAQLDLADLLLDAGQYEAASERLASMTESATGQATAAERSRVHLVDGRIKESRRSFEEAAAAYREALGDDPSNTAAMWALARIEDRLGRAQEALAFFTEALNERSDTEFVLAQALLQISAIEASTGAIDQAMLESADTAISAARTANPSDARLPYYLGRVRQANGRFDEATELYEETIEIDPGFRRAYLRLADVARMSNESEQALAYLDLAAQRGAPEAAIEAEVGAGLSALGESERAADRYAMAIEIDPNSLDARLALAEYYTRVGGEDNYRLALEQLQFVESAGVDDELLHSLYATTTYHLGDIASARERMARIIDDLEVEENAEHLYLMGRIEFDQGAAVEATDDDAALAHFQRAQNAFALAFSRGRSNSETRYWEARAFLALGDHAAAIPAFRRALDISVEEGHVRGDYNYWLGYALEQTRNYAQALQSYRMVDRYDLRWSLENPVVFYRRGLLLADQALLRDAERDFKWVLILEPDHADAASALARLYNREQDYDRALAFWERSLRIHEPQGRVHYEMGMLLNRLERFDESRAHLERARGLGYGESAPLLHRTLGFIYRDQGMPREACVELNQYLDLENPESNSPLLMEIQGQMSRISGCQRRSGN